MMDRQSLNNVTLVHLLRMGLFNWNKPDDLLNQVQQAVRWGVATSTRCMEELLSLETTFLTRVARLLNRILSEEERCDHLEAQLNKHLSMYVKKTRGVDADLTLLGKRADRQCSELNLLSRKEKRQEAFNRHMEERLESLESLTEEQSIKIVELEEAVAILRSRKACKCGETEESTSGSGSQDDPLVLEYTDEDKSNSGASYRTPPLAQEAPLCVIRSPISQTLPSDIREACSCPVPSAVHIEDNIILTVAPRENKEAIPVHVEELPRNNVGVQHASRGRPVAHYSSCRVNCHAKTTGFHPYCHPGYFMGLDLTYPCARELRNNVLASQQGEFRTRVHRGGRGGD